MSTDTITTHAGRGDPPETPGSDGDRRERGRRRGPRRLIGATVAVAVLVSVAAIVLSVIGSSDGNRAADAARVQRVLARIPQHGVTLGNPRARVTVTEFADLQCPYCGNFTMTMLPTLLTEYVEPGKVKLVFEPLSILGRESFTGGQAAIAAADQNKVWGFTAAFYSNEGVENSGYVTPGFLRYVGAQVPGLNVEEMMADSQSGYTRVRLKALIASAAESTIIGTPTFDVDDGRGHSVRLLGPYGLRDAIRRAVAG